MNIIQLKESQKYQLEPYEDDMDAMAKEIFYRKAEFPVTPTKEPLLQESSRFSASSEIRHTKFSCSVLSVKPIKSLQTILIKCKLPFDRVGEVGSPCQSIVSETSTGVDHTFSSDVYHGDVISGAPLVDGLDADGESRDSSESLQDYQDSSRHPRQAGTLILRRRSKQSSKSRRGLRKVRSGAGQGSSVTSNTASWDKFLAYAASGVNDDP